jgi:O-antigen/teichoic acid export membrane protein
MGCVNVANRDRLQRARGKVTHLSASQLRVFSWGFVSQLSSSLTNFGMAWMAARTLGPAGLGSVTLGFSYYLIVLGLQRGLITEPLAASSSALPANERDRAAQSGLVMSGIWSLIVAMPLAAATPWLSGNLGAGLVLFSGWLVPALIQDFWRSVLFRDRRGKAAALNDLGWLAVMSLTAPFVFAIARPWAVVACWGLGALFGAGLGFLQTGFLQTGTHPAPPRQAITWWRSEAWPLGRWLGAGGILYAVTSQAFVFLLAALLGTRAVGGLRAVESVFAPLSMLAPALALPGLPAVSRAAAESAEAGRALAARIGGAATGLASVYVLSAFLFPGTLLAWVFGAEFREFSGIVWPVGLAQILTGPMVGFMLLLIVQNRGRILLFTGVLQATVTLGAGLGLAATMGLVGAAWGKALGSTAQSVAISLAALHQGQGDSDAPR